MEQRRRRMSSTIHRQPRTHVLPPCRVCGEQAKGFHYGVNTCEACKLSERCDVTSQGFFQRSIRRKIPYKCTAIRASSTSLANANTPRKMCPHCRWLRCLQTGMSISGIKIGRYTYEKRTQDILERRSYDEQQRYLRLQRQGCDDSRSIGDLEVDDESSTFDIQSDRWTADAANSTVETMEAERGEEQDTVEDGQSESSGSTTDHDVLGRIRQVAVGLRRTTQHPAHETTDRECNENSCSGEGIDASHSSVNISVTYGCRQVTPLKKRRFSMNYDAQPETPTICGETDICAPDRSLVNRSPRQPEVVTGHYVGDVHGRLGSELKPTNGSQIHWPLPKPEECRFSNRRTRFKSCITRWSTSAFQYHPQYPHHFPHRQSLQQHQRPTNCTRGHSKSSSNASPGGLMTGLRHFGSQKSMPSLTAMAMKERLEDIDENRPSDIGEGLQGGRQLVVSLWMLGLKKGISGVVEIVKQLPGFQTLPTGDQINLIKRSVFEVWLVSRYRAFDGRRRSFSASDGTRRDLDTVIGVDLSDAMLRVATRMQTMDLTDDQIVLTMALIVYVTDGVQLTRPNRVELIQRRMQRTIIHLFERSYNRHRSSYGGTPRLRGTAVSVSSSSSPSSPTEPLPVRSPSPSEPVDVRRRARLAFARLTGVLTELRDVHNAFERFSQRLIRFELGTALTSSVLSYLPVTSSGIGGVTVGEEVSTVTEKGCDADFDVGNPASFWEIFT